MLRSAKKSFLTSLRRVLQGTLRSLQGENFPELKSCGTQVLLESPSKIINPRCISVGDYVKFGPYCQIAPITEYPGPWLRLPGVEVDMQYFDPEIIIGSRVTATSGLNIFCQCSVSIGDGVGFGPNVFINDASHGHEYVDIPFMWQPLTGVAGVSIGKGCWIAANVVIMPGVSVGEQSIIGANSVVTKNIPSYSIAAGIPARVIKRWNFMASKWERVAESMVF